MYYDQISVIFLSIFMMDIIFLRLANGLGWIGHELGRIQAGSNKCPSKSAEFVKWIKNLKPNVAC